MNTCLNGAFYATATALRTHKPRIKLQYVCARRCERCEATGSFSLPPPPTLVLQVERINRSHLPVVGADTLLRQRRRLSRCARNRGRTRQRACAAFWALRS